jgi:hypothetical protein
MTRRYTRKDAAKFITEKLGVPTSPHTLTKLFCVGGGPKCRHVGRRPFYDEPDLVEWVESRLTQPRANSSEPRVIASASEPRVSGKAPPDEPRIIERSSRAAQAQPDAV